MSNSTPFRRPTAIVRDGRSVTDRRYTNSRLTDRTNCRFASAARPFNPDFRLAHSCIRGLSRHFAGRLLSGERCPLSASAKTASA